MPAGGGGIGTGGGNLWSPGERGAIGGGGGHGGGGGGGGAGAGGGAWSGDGVDMNGGDVTLSELFRGLVAVPFRRLATETAFMRPQFAIDYYANNFEYTDRVSLITKTFLVKNKKLLVPPFSSQSFLSID